MHKTIVVTVLVENTVSIRGLMAEHGLAFHIQSGPDSLLFDTGQSGLVMDNAKQMGIYRGSQMWENNGCWAMW